MNVVDVGDFIAKIGFPIAVAAYLLIRIEPILMELVETLGGIREYMRDHDREGK